MVQRARNVLSERDAWYESYDPVLRERILNWIREDQLIKEGIDASGEVIGYYTAYTEFLSGGRKRAGDPYNLYDTGEFHNSLFVIVLNDSIIIDGDGNKGDEDLFQKYGEDIIGLTNENKIKLAAEIKIKYIEYVTRVLYGSR